MSEAVIEDIVALLPPLLQSTDALAIVARRFHPAEFDRVMAALGRPDEPLRDIAGRLDRWPDHFHDVRNALAATCREICSAFDGLRAAQAPGGDLRGVFRALRHAATAQECFYPLAAKFPPISAFFLDPSLRGDEALVTQLMTANAGTGVMHDGTPGARGGYSAYVPENYTDAQAWPLVMALHGGSGNGRAFLWSWLRDARSFGAILVAPTAIGSTWALMSEDRDTPNLSRILDAMRSRYRIDPSRLLLTGMSDGGTFCYVSGLEAASPFTHLAPTAATFHPLMAEIADLERLRGLPIHITHGGRDWMFPVETARHTGALLSAAGARVTYREIDDLSHAYPREINAELLSWMRGG